MLREKIFEICLNVGNGTTFPYANTCVCIFFSSKSMLRDLYRYHSYNRLPWRQIETPAKIGKNSICINVIRIYNKKKIKTITKKRQQIASLIAILILSMNLVRFVSFRVIYYFIFFDYNFFSRKLILEIFTLILRYDHLPQKKTNIMKLRSYSRSKKGPLYYTALRTKNVKIGKNSHFLETLPLHWIIWNGCQFTNYCYSSMSDFLCIFHLCTTYLDLEWNCSLEHLDQA